jgi:hypothetical protein
MEYKEHKISEEDPHCIKELLQEINANINIRKDAKLFIQHKNLQLYPTPEDFTKDDVPATIAYGTLYLIKNNSIIEFSSAIVMKNIDIRMPSMDSFYECLVTIYNLSIDDISEFQNVDSFVGMDELVSHDIDKTIDFFTVLVQTGFGMYKVSS